MPSAAASLDRSSRLASRCGPGWMVYPAWSRSWRMSRIRLLMVFGPDAEQGGDHAQHWHPATCDRAVAAARRHHGPRGCCW